MRGLPKRRDAPHSTRSFARLLLAPTAIIALVLRSACVDAASFAPGESQPDPPTGAIIRPETPETPQTPQTPPSGSGIRWELAPLRYAGSVTYDARMLRLGNDLRSTQQLVFHDIDFATYVWQPWFIQLRGGFGTIVSRDNSVSAGEQAVANSGTSLTGRFAMTVFPASRFPFELRADVSDSRVQGDNFGTDYRSRRLSVSQSYSPEVGNERYSLNFDHSRLSSATNGGGDTVNILYGTAQRQFSGHSIELSGQMTVNQQTDTNNRSRVITLTGRDTFEPVSALRVDTLASWNQLQLHTGGSADRLDTESGIRQISSFATWRPGEGQWLYSASAPVYLNGSVRLVDSSSNSGAGEQRLRQVSASLGATQELTRELRLSGGLSGSLLFPAQGNSSNVTSANVSASYTPTGTTVAGWHYAPSIGTSLAVSRSSAGGSRNSIGAQASHGVSRGFALGESNDISLSLSQSLGLSRDSESSTVSRTLAHSAGMSWQGRSDDSSQSYASLSASDARTQGQESGSFQLLNLQVSRRTQMSRNSSWSGNLTAQASRSDNSSTTDGVLVVPVLPTPAWKGFYSGGLSYENRRVFGVPRLRFTASLTLNSQQLETRAAGDIDAPRERISRSVEGRFDYAVGRLETQLTARAANVEGRKVASVFFRVKRNY